MSSSHEQQVPQSVAAVAPAPKNGLGLAALICGIIGCLCAFVPIAFLVGAPLAVIAVVLGIVGVRRASQGLASNGGTAAFAALLGIIAAFLAYQAGAKIVRTFDPGHQQVSQCLMQAETNEEMNACLE